MERQELRSERRPQSRKDQWDDGSYLANKQHDSHVSLQTLLFSQEESIQLLESVDVRVRISVEARGGARPQG